MVVVVTGPSGSGKSTVGSALASALGWPFHDADDLHPAENVRKMRAGEPLDEEDRGPWLRRLGALVSQTLAAGGSCVIACSALRRAHRVILGSPDPRVRFVRLDVPPERLAERVAARKGHFMPASLVPSQLAALEISDEVLGVDGQVPPAEVVADVRRRLGI